jgi:hypothetical protein
MQENEIKPEHLEIFLKLGAANFLRDGMITSAERNSLAFLVNSGKVFLYVRKNPDQPTENENHYKLTFEGEEHYQNYINVFR